MAFSAVTSRGVTADKTTGTTIDHSPSAEIAIGRAVIVVVAANNTATVDGDSNEHSGVTDTDGHTWTKIGEHTNTAAGAAADGITVSVWRTVTTAAIAVTDVIQATFASVAASAIAVFEATIGSSALAHEPAVFGLLDSATDTDVVVSGLSSREYLWVGITAIEGDEPPTASADADYTFVVGGGTTGGAAATNAGLGISVRIFTGTGDTYTAESGVGGGAIQRVIGLVPIYEAVAGTSVNPAFMAVVSAVPTPVILAAALVAQTTIAASATLPLATVTGAAIVQPAVIAAVATLPTPTILAAATTTPAVVAVTVTLPAPTILAASTVSPAVIAAVASLPTPSVLGAATVIPTTLVVVVALPTPTIDVGGASATVNPAVIAAVVALPTPATLTEATVAPAVIAVLTALPTASVLHAALVAPGVIVVLVALPGPVAGTGPRGVRDPIDYTLNPVAYVPVRGGDTPPPW